jgi:3-phosphoshikimate 1-carboxyvinyltransferase
MKRKLKRSRKIQGTIRVPGDKSIAHRAALLSIISKGPIEAINYPDGADCKTSLKAVQTFGVGANKVKDVVHFSPSPDISVANGKTVDCGNSGTTARLISGIIAGSNLEVTLSGDNSLSARPMKRVVEPLTQMGAEFFSQNGHLPIRIRGRKLLPFEYKLPVPSAQVKSALILAGLASGCAVTIHEDSFTRDHTERMISEIGQGISYRRINPVQVDDPHDPRKKRLQMPEPFKYEVKLSAQGRVIGGTVDIPGDISTASFFMAAAAIGKGRVTIENVGLNPTRAGFIEHLKAIGCEIDIADKRTISNEPRGTVTVTGTSLKSRRISGETTVGLIDEIPLVAVMAAFSEGTTIIRDASELKVKESNRLAAIHDNLKLMGAKSAMLEDGLAIEGFSELTAAEFKSFDDHRIVMSFSIAALFLSGPSTIDDDSSAAVSCPGFYDILDQIS